MTFLLVVDLFCFVSDWCLVYKHSSSLWSVQYSSSCFLFTCTVLVDHYLMEVALSKCVIPKGLLFSNKLKIEIKTDDQRFCLKKCSADFIFNLESLYQWWLVGLAVENMVKWNSWPNTYPQPIHGVPWSVWSQRLSPGIKEALQMYSSFSSSGSSQTWIDISIVILAGVLMIIIMTLLF